MTAYIQTIDTCLERTIGEGGLSDSGFAAARDRAARASETVAAAHQAGEIAFSRVAAQTGDKAQDLRGMMEFARPWAETFFETYVIGTGGSSLGGRTLCALEADHISQPEVNRIDVHFCENADPASPVANHHAWLALEDTSVLVISKSGSTAEVLAHFSRFWEAMVRDRGPQGAAAHFLVITEPGDRPLRRLAESRGIRVLDHVPDLGGRYSLLSPVGLFPAFLHGIDIYAVREGAKEVLDDFLSTGGGSAPALGAAVAIGLMRDQNHRASVLMPYADSLRPFARWYCQLWGESLGKNGEGTMPYPAVGAVDQHSQLQLWLDGPGGALFTLLSPKHPADRMKLDTGGEAPWLDGRSLGDLLNAQYSATAETLAKHGRPVRTFDIQNHKVGAREIGALTMHFMLETVITAHMLGVDPFDQPAVDDGKAITRRMLSAS